MADSTENLIEITNHYSDCEIEELEYIENGGEVLLTWLNNISFEYQVIKDRAALIKQSFDDLSDEDEVPEKHPDFFENSLIVSAINKKYSVLKVNLSETYNKFYELLELKENVISICKNRLADGRLSVQVYKACADELKAAHDSVADCIEKLIISYEEYTTLLFSFIGSKKEDDITPRRALTEKELSDYRNENERKATSGVTSERSFGEHMIYPKKSIASISVMEEPIINTRNPNDELNRKIKIEKSKNKEKRNKLGGETLLFVSCIILLLFSIIRLLGIGEVYRSIYANVYVAANIMEGMPPEESNAIAEQMGREQVLATTIVAIIFIVISFFVINLRKNKQRARIILVIGIGLTLYQIANYAFSIIVYNNYNLLMLLPIVIGILLVIGAIKNIKSKLPEGD